MNGSFNSLGRFNWDGGLGNLDNLGCLNILGCLDCICNLLGLNCGVVGVVCCVWEVGVGNLGYKNLIGNFNWSSFNFDRGGGHWLDYLFNRKRFRVLQ